MKIQTVLSALALAGVLATAPVSGNDPSTAISPSASPATTDDIIEGQVARIDHRTGRLVVNTESGPVSVLATLDALADVEVGDPIVVSLALDD